MPHIRLVTDSTCDIPDNLLKQFDITVVPLAIRLGNGRFLDRTNITTGQLVPVLRDPSRPQPTVEAPDVDDFNRTYRALRETCDGIISIHCSAKLSDTVTNAAIAREAFTPVGHTGPFPIAVVDSQSITMGLGWMVLAIARAARSGLELAKLANLAVRLRGQTHVAFITDQLAGLVRSGVAPNLQPQLSALANFKPLFHVDEGQISVYERTRSRAKARDSLYNFVEDFPRIGEIAVFHADAPNDFDHLMTRVGAIYPRERVVVVQPSCAVTTWFGADMLGVAVFEGEE